MTPQDKRYMREALRLAKRGRGTVSPNPLVGAVLVRNDAIVARGYHQTFGGPHAEINTIRQAGRNAQGATLYVNLEPCNHTGKTGPCTEAILTAGIRRVVIGTLDPNPLVCGHGAARLREQGVAVDSGFCEVACRQVNQGFFSVMERGRPYVLVKVAQTLDGRISRGGTQRAMITSEQAQRYVHRLRAEHDAILIGRRTAELDNPLLTVRYARGPSPQRILLDSRLRLPLTLHVFAKENAANTVVFTTGAAPSHRRQRFEAAGIRVYSIRANHLGHVSIPQAVRKLQELGHNSVIVEGGAQVVQSFFDARVVDALRLIIAPTVFGEGAPLFVKPLRDHFAIQRHRRLGPDTVLEFFVNTK